jgi:hypothetical protein
LKGSNSQYFNKELWESRNQLAILNVYQEQLPGTTPSAEQCRWFLHVPSAWRHRLPFASQRPSGRAVREIITSANGSDQTGSADLETPSLLFKLLITGHLLADFLEKQFHLLTQAHIQT